MKMNVVVTSEPNKRLEGLLENLREHATGWIAGRDVEKSDEVKGKYQIIDHDGDTNLREDCVRIYKGDIIAKGATVIIERLLRRNKIPFKEYENVEVKDPNSKVLHLRLPPHPNLEYHPPKKQSA